MTNKCSVCGKSITYRFSICRDCEAVYGRRVGEWPSWVREVVNFDRRERRFWKSVRAHEVPLSVLREDEDD